MLILRILRRMSPPNGAVMEAFGSRTIGIRVFSHGVISYWLKIVIIPSFDCKSPIRVPVGCIKVHIMRSLTVFYNLNKKNDWHCHLIKIPYFRNN